MDASAIKAQYPGYSGWNDPNAIVADFQKTGGAGKGGSGATTPNPNSSVSSYLQNVNNTVFNGENSPTGSNSTEAQLATLKQEVTGGAQAPTPPNLAATYQGLQSTYGLSGTNGLIAQQTAQQKVIDDINTGLEGQKAKEETTPGLTMDVVAGREGEESRQAQIKLDSANLAMNRITNQINAANTAISTIMQFTQQDYTNAEQYYSDQINTNLQVYQAFQTEKTQEQQVASANLNVITQAISSGNMHYNQLSPAQQSQISTLENQAGLPIGTIASMNPGEQLLFADTKQMISKDANGNLKVTPLPGNSTGGGGSTLSGKALTQFENTYVPQYQDQLLSLSGGDGHVSPEDWDAALQNWEGQGGSLTSFLSKFRKFVDPTHAQDYTGAY